MEGGHRTFLAGKASVRPARDPQLRQLRTKQDRMRKLGSHGVSEEDVTDSLGRTILCFPITALSPHLQTVLERTGLSYVTCSSVGGARYRVPSDGGIQVAAGFGINETKHTNERSQGTRVKTPARTMNTCKFSSHTYSSLDDSSLGYKLLCEIQKRPLRPLLHRASARFHPPSHSAGS